ncbi:hypothetical protein ACFV9G_13615 [Nocardioides sp. NPDC059952]|uniref:hypothetical protein n=1 Tax=Nocardioides sp. NPDC059952 TaxID=3347014 RepID=UPI003665DAD7
MTDDNDDYPFGPRPPEHLRPTPDQLRARLLAMNENAGKAAVDPAAVHSSIKWGVLPVQLDRAGLAEADVPWLTVVHPRSEGDHHE